MFNNEISTHNAWIPMISWPLEIVQPLFARKFYLWISLNTFHCQALLWGSKFFIVVERCRKVRRVVDPWLSWFALIRKQLDQFSTSTACQVATTERWAVAIFAKCTVSARGWEAISLLDYCSSWGASRQTRRIDMLQDRIKSQLASQCSEDFRQIYTTTGSCAISKPKCCIAAIAQTACKSLLKVVNPVSRITLDKDLWPSGVGSGFRRRSCPLECEKFPSWLLWDIVTIFDSRIF